MKRVALLLDHEASLYEQLLAREAQAAATAGELEVLKPVFAEGSSFTQLNQLLGCPKGDKPSDAVMITPAGLQSQLAGARAVAKAGVSMVFVNWQTAERPAGALLQAESYPGLDQLTAA